MTMFAIQVITGPYAGWFVSYLCWTVISILALTTGNPTYTISIKGVRWVWSISQGYLLLRGTWSYLHFNRGSVLPYARLCKLSLENLFDCELYIQTIWYKITEQRLYDIYKETLYTSIQNCSRGSTYPHLTDNFTLQSSCVSQ
jgi:hypothetical protein